MEFKKGNYVTLDLSSPSYAVGIHSGKRGKVLCYAFNYSFELHLEGHSSGFRKATKEEIEYLKKVLIKNKKMYHKGKLIDMPNEI